MKITHFFKTISIALLLFSMTANSYSQAYPIMYLKGASYNSHDRSLRLEADGNGKSYILGSFQSDQLQFGSTVLTNPQPGDQQMFLACIDDSGNWLWAKSENICFFLDDFFNYNEMSYAISLDANKNIYIAGIHKSYSQGSLGAFPVSGNSMFVAKADSLGNWQWVTTTSIVPNDMSVDDSGNILIIGKPAGQYGTSDVLISKISNAGALLWSKSYPTDITWSRYGKIDTDSYGNVIIRACFDGYIQFPLNTYTFSKGCFLAKLDPLGNEIWTQAHAAEDESATTMLVDNNDNILLAGSYNTQIILDSITLSVSGNAGFLAKFNSFGDVIWAKNIAQSIKFFFTDMVIDQMNNITIGGSIESIFINFYDTLVGSGAFKKGFVVSYDSVGDFRFVKHDLSNSTVINTGVGVDNHGKIYTTGVFHDPSFSIEGLTYTGFGTNANIYVYQITGCGMILQTNVLSDISCFGATDGSAEVIVSSGSPPYMFLWNDNSSQTTQTASNLGFGNYSVTVTDNSGCIESTNAIINQPNFNDNLEICAVTVDSATSYNMIIWNKQQSAGIGYYYVFCESPVVGIYNLIHLAHADSSNFYIDPSSNPAQKSYKYKIVVSDSICNNISPNHSATHKTIHLTANVGTSGENNLIWTHYEGLTIPSYYIYRSNNNNQFELLDVVTGTLTSYSDMAPPTGLNRYFISIDDVNCNASKNTTRITSNRIQLGVANISENGIAEFFNIYPNPNDGRFCLQLSETYKDATIRVVNSLGFVVFEMNNFTGNMANIEIEKARAGIYFLNIRSESLSSSLKFIVQ